jgi:hypothetical protein
MRAERILGPWQKTRGAKPVAVDWLELTQDILVAVFLFALRVGVPVAILFAVGAFIKKALEEPEPGLERQAAQDKVELHCWETKNCPEEERVRCPAYNHPQIPCWLALQQEGQNLKEACYTCPLYTIDPGHIQSQPASA